MGAIGYIYDDGAPGHLLEPTYAGQEISVTETATSFYNERQKIEISLDKSVMTAMPAYGLPLRSSQPPR